MTTAAALLMPYGLVRDLIDQEAGQPYLFRQHTLHPSHVASFQWHAGDHRSFVVIKGCARLDVLTESGVDSVNHGYLEGWHALPGSVYRVANAGSDPLVILEAGTESGETQEATEPESLRHLATGRCIPVSYYTVRKPWGHEIWYTHNLTDPGYAMKQIHMTQGNQSSLQSHQYKAETNYVIDGEATVLNGRIAPDDLHTRIDPDTLPRSVRGPLTGWTSAPRVLHRVIARSDYTSIEVSTPQLDDVIRWQDDTGRTNGRIDAEHQAVRS